MTPIMNVEIWVHEVNIYHHTDVRNINLILCLIKCQKEYGRD